VADLSLVVATIAGLGAVAAGLTALRRPLLCLGILFLLSTASRITLETVVGTMRLEQPAIAVVAVVLVAGGRLRELRRLPRSMLAVGAGFGIYLAAQAMSAALVAPDPISSIRLTLWLAISMAGGGVALILALSVDREAGPIFVIGGASNAAVGLSIAVLFLVLGPDFQTGVQEIWSASPRVYGLARETNLFAGLLAICAPFALEELRASPRWQWLVVTVLVVGSMPLGATRGAYLGLVAGLAAYGTIHLINGARPWMLRVPSAAAVSALVVGIVAATALLPNALERYVADTGGTAASPSPLPAVSPSASESMRPSPTPETSARPLPTLVPVADTITFRLDRVPVALDDLRASPLIGLGPGSFGQLHVDPSQDAPDHIAILAIASLHDAGLIGTAGLVAAFVLLLRGLFAHARTAGRVADRRGVGIAAAYCGSIVAMLVSYQATNALHFGLNWIIVGAAVAAITQGPRLERARSQAHAVHAARGAR
jgi:hypothetical protein